MKKFLFLFVLVLSFFAFQLPVYAMPTSYTRTTSDLRLPSDVTPTSDIIDKVLRTPSVDAKEKIYDFADLLTDAEESKIYIQLNEYIQNTGLDATIVTTDNLNGFEINEYTYNFYDYNDFQASGVAFVIYKGPEGVSIFMGNNGPRNGEVFAAYTDNRTAQILKYVYEHHIRSENYVGACEDYIKLIDGFYIKTFGEYKVGDPKEELKKEIPWVTLIIVSLTLTFIIVVLVFTKYQKPERRVDLTIKKAFNTTSSNVKCEYDKPVNWKNNGNS